MAVPNEKPTSRGVRGGWRGFSGEPIHPILALTAAFSLTLSLLPASSVD